MYNLFNHFFATLLIFISAYAQASLKLDKASGVFFNDTQISAEGAGLEISISSLHPGGFDGRTFYGRSCLNEKVFKAKIAKDGSYELPVIELENPYSKEYCLSIKLNHLELDHQPTSHVSFSSHLEYIEAIQELYLEKTYIDKEKLTVKAPNGLSFQEYAKEILRGTSLIEDENYTWEFSISYSYKAKDASNLRRIPFLSEYNTIPCNISNDRTKKCFATKGDRSTTSQSKELYSTLSSKGRNIYHLVSKPMGPLREFLNLNYNIELSLWNLKTGNRDFYTKVNPKFNQSQINSGYKNYIWGNTLPSETLQEFEVELNSDFSQLNETMKSKIKLGSNSI